MILPQDNLKPVSKIRLQWGGFLFLSREIDCERVFGMILSHGMNPREPVGPIGNRSNKVSIPLVAHSKSSLLSPDASILVEWAPDGKAGLVHHVCVDHGSPDVLVTQ